jgi:hypothetical protein
MTEKSIPEPVVEQVLSPADVDNGCKQLTLETLDGRGETITVVGPSWRQREALLSQITEANGTAPLIHWCLKNPDNGLGTVAEINKFLDRLTPASNVRIEQVCLAFCLGNAEEKKMREAAMKLAQQVMAAKLVPALPDTKPSSAPSLPSSAPDTKQPTFELGATPSSSSISGSTK